MFPWVYEFQWNAGHIIFITAFFSVLCTVFSSVIAAAMRSMKDIQQRKIDAIQWEVNFEDLPVPARVCRHELTGEVKHRTCDHEFHCGSCNTHQVFLSRDTRGHHLSPADSGSAGLTMPSDRFYHRGHSWVKGENDGTMTVGLDDFGSRLIGKPDAIELPPVGTRLAVNGTGWHIEKNGVKVRILSPLDGEVIEHGGTENEWLFRVKADNPATSSSHLLRGEEIYPWISREIERLQFSLAPRGAAATLADGGELMPDISKNYPDVNWDAVWGDMFLEA